MGRVQVMPFLVEGKGNVSGRLYQGVLMPNNPIMLFNEAGEIINFSDVTIPGVSTISLVNEKGVIYDYSIQVKAGCPKGYVTMDLEFVDESNDVYHLNVTNGTSKTHTVNYNSVKPNIKEIRWSIRG